MTYFNAASKETARRARAIAIEVNQSVEQQSFRDQVMQREHADLFEQVGEQDVIVGLEPLLQQPPEGGTRRLAVKRVRDGDEDLRMLGRHPPEIRSRPARVSSHSSFGVAV